MFGQQCVRGRTPQRVRPDRVPSPSWQPRGPPSTRQSVARWFFISDPAHLTSKPCDSRVRPVCHTRTAPKSRFFHVDRVSPCPCTCASACVRAMWGVATSAYTNTDTAREIERNVPGARFFATRSRTPPAVVAANAGHLLHPARGAHAMHRNCECDAYPVKQHLLDIDHLRPDAGKEDWCVLFFI